MRNFSRALTIIAALAAIGGISTAIAPMSAGGRRRRESDDDAFRTKDH